MIQCDGSGTKLLLLQGSAEAGLDAGECQCSDLDTEVEQRTQGIHKSDTGP